jgi:hypothetical protein
VRPPAEHWALEKLGDRLEKNLSHVWSRARSWSGIDKLLMAVLIEPSMSDWASPALIRVKKDSTPEDVKIKFAIDYRRVNAVTVPAMPVASGLNPTSCTVLAAALSSWDSAMPLEDSINSYYQPVVGISRLLYSPVPWGVLYSNGG